MKPLAFGKSKHGLHMKKPLALGKRKKRHLWDISPEVTERITFKLDMEGKKHTPKNIWKVYDESQYRKR